VASVALQKFAAVTLALVLGAAEATADSVGDFYKGKAIDFYIGTGEGSGAITGYPIAISQFIGKYIPGHPAVNVVYMPGGAGIKAGNFIYGVGPQDGTIVGFMARGFVIEPLIVSQAQFDATKFNWIGSTARETSVGAVWAASTDVRTIQNAMKEQVIVGGTALSNDTGLFPTMLNRFIGTKFKVITGYKSTPEVELAMERGEVQGKIGWTWGSLNSGRTAKWVKDQKVFVLIQLGLQQSPKIPSDIPNALDLARNKEDRQVMGLIFAPTAIGYPSFMGPGVPQERVEAIRQAYVKTMHDPGFIELLDRENLPLDPMSGEEIKKMVDGIFTLPPSVIQHARDLIPPS
jgi:tripartite-type tricarboxylate transporter receptor subunit TctC